MRSPIVVSAPRRILCVYPAYARSFGTFQHSYGFFGGRVRAFMPPQGLLAVAAYVPPSWDVRFVDENSRVATDADFRWADAVFVSGMHIQRAQIHDITRRAHAHGRLVVVGGPSVSGCPEYYPDADILHLGEIGDATDRLFAHLDRDVGRPPKPLRFETVERLPLSDFPTPAYDLIRIREYFIANIQFSSGCPYTCEFCDIPELYGRNPRLKTAAQILRELDEIAAAGATSVYFVDDNFIGNQKAALEMLPHLVQWQTRHRYPLRFACEATLNIAKNGRVLELMREAGFITVFCGIETPEPAALHFISKDQNLRMPILEAVERINSYGMEVVSGIIIGLDTDTARTADHIIEFVEASKIPLLTINVLYALPKTPLWRRLEAEGRLMPDSDQRESNVVFKLPYDEVLGMWRRCITAAYEPSALYERYAHNVVHTFANRKDYPSNAQRASWSNVVMGLGILRRLLWRVGVRGDYRRTFWRMAWPLMKARKVEALIHAAMVSHHLIEFTRECLRGGGQSSFYAPVNMGGLEGPPNPPDARQRRGEAAALLDAPDGRQRGGEAAALLDAPDAWQRGGEAAALLDAPDGRQRGGKAAALLDPPDARQRGGGAAALLDSPDGRQRDGGAAALLDSPDGRQRDGEAAALVDGGRRAGDGAARLDSAESRQRGGEAGAVVDRRTRVTDARTPKGTL